MREIRVEFCTEQDPVKRQEILDRLLSLIEERWKQLLGVIAEEHDPAQLREMITELSTILEERKEGAQNSEKIPSLPPKAKAQSPGRMG